MIPTAQFRTRERILDAAEVLFAQKGFSAVRVREITRASRCNLAAVNYHFRTKKNLYLEVFTDRWIPRALQIQSLFWDSLGTEPPASPAPVVEALTRAFWQGLEADEQRTRHHQLMARELAQPSEAFDLIVERVMRPFFTRLIALLRPLVNDGIGDATLMLDFLSIFAMVMHFNFARPAVTRLTGRDFDAAFQARLTDHLVAFSLHGLSAQVKDSKHVGR